jgi:hypothetical protein
MPTTDARLPAGNRRDESPRSAILRPLIRSKARFQALDSYLPHTPRLRVFKPCPAKSRPDPPADPRSPSQVSNALRPRASMLPAVTSLVGVTPRASSRMCGTPRHSFREPGGPGPRFPQAEEASSRVPLATKFFAIWHRLRWDSLASPCGPFMVELFIRGAFLLSAPRRAAADPPGPPVTRSETPHASRVERTAGECSTVARTPRTGLAGFHPRHPLRVIAASSHLKGSLRSFPVAPLPSPGSIRRKASGRMLGFGPDFRSSDVGAQQAPVEPDKPLSRHPAPRVTTKASCTLSAVVAGRSQSLRSAPRLPGWWCPFSARHDTLRVNDAPSNYNAREALAPRIGLDPSRPNPLSRKYSRTITALTARRIRRSAAPSLVVVARPASGRSDAIEDRRD